MKNSAEPARVSGLPPTSAYRVELDFLRALAMLYVVGVWHLCGYSPPLYVFVNAVTHLIVYCVLGLFVFISGFLLSQRYAPGRSSDVFRFWLRRAVRVYPMFLVALTGFLAMGLIDLRTYLRSTVALNMLLNEPLMTLWFVTMMLVLYAVAPLYLASRSLARTVAAALLPYAALVVVHVTLGLVDLRLPQYLVVFVAGIVAARSHAVWGVLHKKAVIAASVLLFPLAFLAFLRYAHPIVQSLILDCAIFLSIPVFFFIGEAAARVMNRRVIRLAAYSSFAMYLLHRITFGIGLSLYEPSTVATSLLYLVGVILPATGVASYAAQRAYDTIAAKVLRAGAQTQSDRPAAVDNADTDWLQ